MELNKKEINGYDDVMDIIEYQLEEESWLLNKLQNGMKTMDYPYADSNKMQEEIKSCAKEKERLSQYLKDLETLDVEDIGEKGWGPAVPAGAYVVCMRIKGASAIQDWAFTVESVASWRNEIYPGVFEYTAIA